ncbi:hypothetical protein JL721_632 [Aureococcus anophagefferens]|nr:hypothetical protein JL721_632 [Aureococcus anophagefferens]
MPDAVAECLFEMLLTEAVKLDFPGEGPIIGPSGETASSRPELHGYEVGYRFVERIAQARVLAADHLEAIKFICKDVWNEIFGKQIDKLQTNHRGVFVLKDYTFRWLARVSSDDAEAMKRVTANILQFPCGVLRGALANLGIVATVTAEYGTLPSCSFSIRIQGNDARFDKA